MTREIRAHSVPLGGRHPKKTSEHRTPGNARIAGIRFLLRLGCRLDQPNSGLFGDPQSIYHPRTRCRVISQIPVWKMLADAAKGLLQRRVARTQRVNPLMMPSGNIRRPALNSFGFTITNSKGHWLSSGGGKIGGGMSGRLRTLPNRRLVVIPPRPRRQKGARTRHRRRVYRAPRSATPARFPPQKGALRRGPA